MKRQAVREYLSGALWVLPTLAVLLALVAGSVVSLVHLDASSAFAPLLFQGTSEDAPTLLIGISATMVTVIALVLGLTLIALQLASTQFSPLLRVGRDVAWFWDESGRAVVGQFIKTLLNDVRRMVAQPADREPLLDVGRRLVNNLTSSAPSAVATFGGSVTSGS